jgi:hypothetical protein
MQLGIFRRLAGKTNGPKPPMRACPGCARNERTGARFTDRERSLCDDCQELGPPKLPRMMPGASYSYRSLAR